MLLQCPVANMTLPYRYSFNKRRHSVSLDEPYFQRLADEAGEFSIISLAHQSKLCKTAVSDIQYSIRELPSARVSQGRRVVESISEGEQLTE